MVPFFQAVLEGLFAQATEGEQRAIPCQIHHASGQALAGALRKATVDGKPIEGGYIMRTMGRGGSEDPRVQELVECDVYLQAEHILLVTLFSQPSGLIKPKQGGLIVPH